MRIPFIGSRTSVRLRGKAVPGAEDRQRSHNDNVDHDALVAARVKLYASLPGCAVVECSCLDFSTFLLNEAHIRVPMDRLTAIHI